MTIHDSQKIDLTAAEKVAGTNTERQLWIRAMLEPGGMAPGSSSRAHARAFRFAEALKKAGYRVTEAPHGPRGGRRFTLDRYDGPRAGAIYRLQCHRSCSLIHPLEECSCFNDLTEEHLKLVTSVHRKTGPVFGSVYGTDRVASLLRAHGEGTFRTATDLYVAADLGSIGGPCLEAYLAFVDRYNTDMIRNAIALFRDIGGTRRGGPTLDGHLALLAHHDFDTVRSACALYARTGGADAGPDDLADLITALESAAS